MCPIHYLPIWVCLLFFLGLAWSDRRKKNRRQVLFLSHHNEGMCCAHGITNDAKLHHLINRVIARFPHCKATKNNSFPFPTQLF